MKRELVWLGRSLREVRSFPISARRDVGYQLWRIQQGERPFDWRPMTSIGRGVRELRVHSGGEFRVLYTVRPNRVYVLHGFEKKSRKTLAANLDIARRRLNRIGEQ